MLVHDGGFFELLLPLFEFRVELSFDGLGVDPLAVVDARLRQVASPLCLAGCNLRLQQAVFPYADRYLPLRRNLRVLVEHDVLDRGEEVYCNIASLLELIVGLHQAHGFFVEPFRRRNVPMKCIFS